MPNFINGVPTLVLDYDKEIDMVNDHEARHEYATQVKAYFDFVKDFRNKKQQWVTDWLLVLLHMPALACTNEPYAPPTPPHTPPPPQKAWREDEHNLAYMVCMQSAMM